MYLSHGPTKGANRRAIRRHNHLSREFFRKTSLMPRFSILPPILIRASKRICRQMVRLNPALKNPWDMIPPFSGAVVG
jgi:hypothetical protein